MERGVQQVDARGRSAFLELAAGLGLGVAAREKIGIEDLSLAREGDNLSPGLS